MLLGVRRRLDHVPVCQRVYRGHYTTVVMMIGVLSAGTCRLEVSGWSVTADNRGNEVATVAHFRQPYTLKSSSAI